MREHSHERLQGLLSPALLALSFVIVFGVQYTARHIDDNRLTSWEWAFAKADPAVVGILVVLGCILGWYGARWRVIDRRPLSVLLIASFCSGALFWSEPEVIVDSARYFTQAKHLELYGLTSFFKEWGRAIPAWTDLPLFPFLYGLLFKLFGESRVWIQILTTLLFSFTVMITYRLGRELWDEETGFLGGLLLLGMPYLYSQVPLMLVDVGTMFFYVLALLVLLLALRRGGGALLTAASLVIAGAALTKYSVWVLFTDLIVVFLVVWRGGCSSAGATGLPGHDGRGRSVIKRGAIIAAGTVLVLGGLFALYHEVVIDQIRLLREFQRPGLRRWGESHISTFCFQIHPLLTAAALYSAYAAFRKKDVRFLIIGWTVFLLLLLRIERIRYLMTVFPMLGLMAAYGLRQIDGRQVRRSLALSAVLSSIVIAVAGYLPFLKTVSTVNLKEAGAYLDTLGPGTVTVVTQSSEAAVLNPAVYVPILDLHMHRAIRYVDPRDHVPPRAEIETSPLRFTWEHRDPLYYAFPAGSADNADRIVVVISTAVDQPLPLRLKTMLAGHRSIRTFNIYDGVYQARSFVTVFEAAPAKL